MSRREFVVVGGGLVGLAVTRELARRGRDVLCLEQDTIGHARSGSKGTARIFRYSYRDPFYVELAMRALPGWLDLSDEVGERLLEPTGLLSIGRGVVDLHDIMRRAGASTELLRGEELSERFGDFAITGPAVFEPTAGVLRADAVLSALAASGRALGAEIVESTAVGGIDAGDAEVRLETGHGPVECEVVVLCGGAWSGALGAAAGLPVADLFAASLQQVAYLEMPAHHGLLPSFVEEGAITFYGVPASGRYKVGLHDPGESVDPGAVSLDDDPVALATIAAAARRLLPGMEIVDGATERCFYDNTANEDFVLDRRGRVVIGGGSSGHGFKFGPVWGEVLADLAEGREPAIAMGRFSLSGRAAPDPA